MAYGLRAADYENTPKFSVFDVEEYLSFKTNGLSLRTTNVIKQIVWTFHDFTQGCLSKEYVIGFSRYILDTYKSDSSINKFFIYTRHFVNFLAKTRNDPSIGLLLYYLEKPKKRREQKLLTPFIVVDEDIRNTVNRITHCQTIGEETKDEFIAFFLFLVYSGQRVMTASRLTVAQFRTALQSDPQTLVVEASQDKIRLAHMVPIHPSIIPLLMPMIHDRDDTELMFNYEPFMKWLRKHPIPLKRSDGRMGLKLARKYFEQKSDDLNLNQTYLQYITSHGVSGVQWTNYKQFLPENVYKRYMEAWGAVNLLEGDATPDTEEKPLSKSERLEKEIAEKRKMLEAIRAEPEENIQADQDRYDRWEEEQREKDNEINTLVYESIRLEEEIENAKSEKGIHW